MNKGLKITLIIVSIFILLIISIGYFALEMFGKAFGSDCKKNNSWSVKEYEVVEYICLGWAGPPYYPLYLNKNGKEIANNGHKQDSCIFTFKTYNDLYLKLNICHNEITKITPPKKEIELQTEK